MNKNLRFQDGTINGYVYEEPDFPSFFPEDQPFCLDCLDWNLFCGGIDSRELVSTYMNGNIGVITDHCPDSVVAARVIRKDGQSFIDKNNSVRRLENGEWKFVSYCHREYLIERKGN